MKNLINTVDNDKVSVPEPVVQQVDSLFRVVTSIILFSATDFTILFPEYPQLAQSLAILGTLLYLVITYVLSLGHAENTSKHHFIATMGYIDSLVLGSVLFLAPFPLSIYIAIALLTSLRAVAYGGLNGLFGHAAVFGLGSALSFIMIQPDLVINTEEHLNGLVIMAIPCFLIYVGWSLFNRQQLLESALKRATLQNKQLKVNNYRLAKYLSPSLRKAIFSGKRVKLETQRKRLSVFFSDIKGFSELSEELETDTLTEMLNLYLSEMSDIALKFGGTIDKFIGDAVMVFFGDPTSRGPKEDAIACVSMALAMQKRMQDLNQRWSAQGIRHPLQIRIGINTGFCTVGNFGTENRMDYTLLGTEVNKASRLESAAQSGEILVSRSTYELVKDTIYCESRGTARLKGYAEPVEIFTAVDLRTNLGKDDQCIDKVTDGFSLYLDVDTIPHMQKQPVLAALEQAYDQIRKDINRVTKEDVKIIK
jgi:Adenylate cyclase, family 3 (some proteins contain HAMP domain)